MQMLHGLTAFLARVRHDAEAFFGNAELLSKLRDDIDEDVRDERLVLFFEGQQALTCFFGITRTCCGACGSRSRKATTMSSS